MTGRPDMRQLLACCLGTCVTQALMIQLLIQAPGRVLITNLLILHTSYQQSGNAAPAASDFGAGGHSREWLLSSSRSRRRMTLLDAVRGRLSRHSTCAAQCTQPLLGTI